MRSLVVFFEPVFHSRNVQKWCCLHTTRYSSLVSDHAVASGLERVSSYVELRFCGSLRRLQSPREPQSSDDAVSLRNHRLELDIPEPANVLVFRFFVRV